MTPPQPPAERPSVLKSTLLWVLKIGVSAGLLYLLFVRIDAGNLWRLIRNASPLWVAAALTLYVVMLLVSTWRWQLLLRAQHVHVAFGSLLNSFFVAIFANNFLPSNIGGDVFRIKDTAKPAGSKTLAAAVVLFDRGLGVLGLAFVAACGSTLAARRSEAIGPLGPSLLWTGLLVVLGLVILVLAVPRELSVLARPLRMIHPEWVDQRVETITAALVRFRQAPGAMLAGFGGGIAVQAILVGYYAAVANALHITVPIGHLAILVPVSFIVQMMPLSLNGLGVREATFGLYLTKIGVPLESAMALSFIGAGLVMAFSMSGAAAYLSRRRTYATTPAES
ncbi:MAG TPA: lysylphosphatidylglycerol synthase transmembrane domain-containing protein [Vicinamibacterales bacterium]|nr:lysylphosphatidylglycerol synthase transmembrane domain-containing protein [Vicinamibacterales bacterium]